MNKRVTIVDIARETGVSVSSVSKALMDASDISEKTKEIIRKKAEELGYVQNISAASLKSGTSKIIGILCDDLINPYYNAVIYHLEIFLSKQNYTISIYRADRFDMSIYNKLLGRSVEGIISFLIPEKEVISKLQKQYLPLVLLGRYCKHVSSVHCDDEKIGKLAAEYVLSKNCSNAIYLGESERLNISILRGKGFIDELMRNNVNVLSYYNNNGEDFTKILQKLSDELIKYDAIFCFNDMMAFETIRYFSKIGKKNVIIVGVDNIHTELKLPFPMVSIGANKEIVAKRSVEVLTDQINNKNREIKNIIEDIQLYSFE